MASTDLRKRAKGSLTDQIADVERRLLERRRVIAIRKTCYLLGQQVRQQMTSPTTLLLAGGIGFIIGDLTQSKKKSDLNQEAPSAPSPLFQSVDKVVAWVRPIFLAEVGKVAQSLSATVSTELSDHLSRFSEKIFAEKPGPSSDET
ncbi:MAG: hypothetical protein IPK63_14920 [Candidatus Competibacteraceae bacterium]|nr:hypothetical protein [Candidatus Competibacteraceae bacterium]